ncbi:MAG: proteasome subunit beta [Candidatus Hermodarchaeota archaeon]|nr:proteasome subunit beta [Candidatus Hermodarchaeota archaeon]
MMESKDKHRLMSHTTTVAVKVDGGIILGTESQATMGYLVASDTAPKILQITDRIAMTISGSVADAQQLINNIRAIAQLEALEKGRELSVKAVSHLTSSILFRNRMFPLITMLIVGGVDEEGGHVYMLDPLGSMLEEDEFTATGSGSVVAYGVLEDEFKQNMSIEEGKQLVVRAVNAARRRDIASGGSIQLAVINTSGVTISKELIE